MSALMGALVDGIVYILGISVVGLIFMFLASLMLITTYLAILIGKELYETYIRDIFEKLKENRE